MNTATTATQRAFSALRYLPSAIVVMLLLSWLLGIFRAHAVTVFYRDSRDQQIELTLVSEKGSLGLNRQPNYSPLQTFTFRKRDLPYSLATTMGGEFSFRQGELRGGRVMRLAIPIPWIITALLPLAVGAFTRFRFSLAMWLIWVTILGFECACYVLILREFGER